MMLVVLFGVTGVGKTTIGRLVAGRLGWAFYDADDFHPAANVQRMRRGIPLTDEDRVPWLQALRDLIGSCLSRGEPAVLACSALKSSYRRMLRVSDDVQFVYLKGAPSLIQQRLEQRRSHFMNPALLQSQLDTLEEPAAGEAIVVDVAGTPGEIADSIRSHLSSDPNISRKGR